MVRIRLTRKGRKKKPYYHVVVADVRMPRDGRFIEIVGFYEPQATDKQFELNLERVDHWLSVGASPSDTVKSIIKKFRKLAPVQAAPAAV